MNAPEMLTNEDGLSWLGVGLTYVYFVLAFVAVRLVKRQTTVVVRYEPPGGISPAAAAWLLERGELPRAIGAAILSAVAKGVLTIERFGDTYHLRKLSSETQRLTPEEKSLLYSWFQDADTFSLPARPDLLKAAVRDFGSAVESVLNPTYFTKNVMLYAPAWVLSGMTVLFALYNGNILDKVDDWGVFYVLPYGFFYIWGMLIVGSHSLFRTLRKLATFVPGRNVPHRPLVSRDLMPLGLLLLSLVGLVLLAGMSSITAASVIAALLALNAVFFRLLWAPTPAGREVIHQIEDYKKFLAEVDADPVTRTQWPDGTPLRMSEKVAYALAFGIDLGWGERFVTTIADSVESAALFFAKPNVCDNPKDPLPEMNLK